MDIIIIYMKPILQKRDTGTQVYADSQTQIQTQRLEHRPPTQSRRRTTTLTDIERPTDRQEDRLKDSQTDSDRLTDSQTAHQPASQPASQKD